MGRHLSDDQLRELDHLKEWSLTILNFRLAKQVGSDPLIEELIQTTIKVHSARNLRGMRTIARDDNEQARGMNPADLGRLNGLLREKFGEDLSDNMRKDLVKIGKIRHRGKIRTEDEFRLVQGRVDEIWQDATKKDEMDALNQLLNDFEFGGKNAR
jgi:hypothetical protein